MAGPAFPSSTHPWTQRQPFDTPRWVSPTFVGAHGMDASVDRSTGGATRRSDRPDWNGSRSNDGSESTHEWMSGIGPYLHAAESSDDSLTGTLAPVSVADLSGPTPLTAEASDAIGGGEDAAGDRRRDAGDGLEGGGKLVLGQGPQQPQQPVEALVG